MPQYEGCASHNSIWESGGQRQEPVQRLLLVQGQQTEACSGLLVRKKEFEAEYADRSSDGTASRRWT